MTFVRPLFATALLSLPLRSSNAAEQGVRVGGADLPLSVSAATLPHYVADLAAGYAVGFRTQSVHDTGNRTIRVLTWYPAPRSRGSAVQTLGDLIVSAGLSDRPFPPGEEGRRAVIADSAILAQLADFAGRKLTDDEAGRILATPMLATSGRSKARGRFPLVLLGNGLTPPYYLHWSLAETLASHGYVVAALAGSSPAEQPPFTLHGIERVASDMAIAMRELRADANVDGSRTALVGWSVGGLAHAFVQPRDTAVRAMVSLDGGTGYAYGAELLDSARDVVPQHVSVPYLHFTGDAPGHFAVPKDSSYFEHARGPAYLVHLAPLSHAEFTSVGLRARQLLDPDQAGASVAAYRAVTQYTLWFLNAYVHNDTRARELLRNPWQSLPLARDQLSVTYRAPP